MQYRRHRQVLQDTIRVGYSQIHGRGLYAKRPLVEGEMIIEYAGELIRPILTDYRERYYDSKGIGCYMFRVDEEQVVDATEKGNAARFVNHACLVGHCLSNGAWPCRAERCVLMRAHRPCALRVAKLLLSRHLSGE